MSNMLEQAIVDAAALREAALKNAEQSIIEKYAPQIKEAVEAMLENEGAPRTHMCQGRTVSVIHEADEDGNVTVSEAGGKPFVVKETDLSEATEDQILQEEEMDAAGDVSTAPPTEIEAPPAWDSRYGETESVTLTAMLDNVDEDGNIESNLDAMELSMAEKEASMETPLEEPVSDLSLDSETPTEETPTDDAGGEIDDLLGDLGGGDEDADMQLQELLDLLSEYDEELIEEDINVDMGEAKDGWIDTNEGSLEYKRDMEEAKDAHSDDDDEEEESEEDNQLQEAKQEIDLLQQTFLVLKEQNEKLESVVHKLNEKLEETLLSNAKLLYQNRTLNDASLNERQKTKIVEAIAKAESPKEAKRLHETLRATVGSDQKKRSTITE